MCDDQGRCVIEGLDAGPRADADCPRVAVDLAPQTPTVELLIDRSGSMTASFGGANRWKAVQDALTDPDGGVVTQLESRVVFGASLYNSDGGGSFPDECPILRSVEPALDNAAAIGALFDDNGPHGDTPTAESIQLLAERFPPSGGPRIIVLATDGEPDTCAEPNPQHGQDEAIAAARAAQELGIETVILSVGSGVSDDHLQDMANAGAGLPVGGGQNAPYYRANNQQQLVSAFDAIIKGVRSCEIDVSGSVDVEQARDGTVVLNGVTLEFGTDWQMLDADTLELLGGACETLLDTDEVSLEASFPCGAIVL